MVKKKEGFNISIPTVVFYSILIAIAGFGISVNTRVAVLESNGANVNKNITEMSVKIDKIYEKFMTK